MGRSVAAVVDESTLAWSAGGSITGVITLVGDEWIYPEPGWSDFPVVILSWWLRGCQRVGSRKGASSEFRFMDGSFSFKATSLGGKEWQIECFGGNGKAESHIQVVSGEDFQKQLRVVAASIIKTCRERGWKSRDLEELASYV